MGSSRSTPTSSTVQQVRQEYPAYFQPYLEDVLKGSQEQYQRDYEPFPESRLVDTPESRTDALTSLQDMSLARMSQGAYDDAISNTQAAGAGFPDTNMEAYMNPYQQLVTDQLLRNATERRGVARKGIGDAAARSGAYGGSRQAVSEGMFDRDTQRSLTDIEERGNMAAFQNALSASQADKQRQLTAAAQQAQLGQSQQQALTSGIAGVEKAATAEQALAQQARDIAQQDFRSQEGFDQQKLAEYSAIIRGATPPANQFIDKTTLTPQSGLQQAAGLASIGSSLFGFGKAQGGPVEYAAGGTTYARGGDVTQDVVTDAIDKLAGIGMGKITMPTPGMDALHAVIAPASAPMPPVQEDIQVTEDIDVMGMDGATGLQGLGQAQDDNDDGFNPDNATEITEEMSETMMGNAGGPEGLAYGGVPGQAYTEGIGMMGGLASVAGPQMRFAGGEGVPSAGETGFQKYIREGREKIKERDAKFKNERTARAEEIQKSLMNKFDQDVASQAKIRTELQGLTSFFTDKEGGPEDLRKQEEKKQVAKKYKELTKNPEVEVIKETTGPDGTSLDAVIAEQGYGDNPNDVVFGEMEMETPAPKKEQPLKPNLPKVESKPFDMKGLQALSREQGISDRDKLAAGLALLTGRESGLTEASRAISGAKGNASDLDVELKGLDASSKNEKNKAALAETLRKRAADRSKRMIEIKNSSIKIIKLQDKIANASDANAIKLWEAEGLIGQMDLLGFTEKELKNMTPALKAARIRKAVASLRSRRPV